MPMVAGRRRPHNFRDKSCDRRLAKPVATTGPSSMALATHDQLESLSAGHGPRAARNTCAQGRVARSKLLRLQGRTLHATRGRVGVRRSSHCGGWWDEERKTTSKSGVRHSPFHASIQPLASGCRAGRPHERCAHVRDRNQSVMTELRLHSV